MLKILITDCTKDIVSDTFRVSGKITKYDSNVILTHLYMLFMNEINNMSIEPDDSLIFFDMDFYELCTLTSYGFFIHFNEDYDFEISDSIEYAQELYGVSHKYFHIK